MCECAICLPARPDSPFAIRSNTHRAARASTATQRKSSKWPNSKPRSRFGCCQNGRLAAMNGSDSSGRTMKSSPSPASAARSRTVQRDSTRTAASTRPAAQASPRRRGSPPAALSTQRPAGILASTRSTRLVRFTIRACAVEDAAASATPLRASTAAGLPMPLFLSAVAGLRPSHQRPNDPDNRRQAGQAGQRPRQRLRGRDRPVTAIPCSAHWPQPPAASSRAVCSTRPQVTRHRHPTHRGRRVVQHQVGRARSRREAARSRARHRPQRDRTPNKARPERAVPGPRPTKSNVKRVAVGRGIGRRGGHAPAGAVTQRRMIGSVPAGGQQCWGRTGRGQHIRHRPCRAVRSAQREALPGIVA